MAEIIILILTLGKEKIEIMQDQCLIEAGKDQFLVLIFLLVCVYVFHIINI